MRFPFFILLLVLFAVVADYGLGANQSYVTLAVGTMVVRVRLLLLVAGSLLFLTFFYFLFRFLGKLLSLPGELRQARQRGRLKQAERDLGQGLARMIEGAWAKAEQRFLCAAEASSMPHVVYLLAARAAQQQGASERCQQHIQSARQHGPDRGLLADLTQAGLLLGEQDETQALAELSELQEKRPKQRQLNEMLLEMHTRMGNWRQVLALVNKRGLLPRELAQTRQENAWIEMLHGADDAEALKRLWSEIPQAQRSRTRVIEAYVSQCLRYKSAAHCERLLRRALKRHWDSGLLRLYGLVRGARPARQLVWLEGQLSAHADDPVLLLSLGRLAAGEQLWARARAWLEASIAAGTSPDACYELAALHRRAGDTEAATEVLQQGMELALGEADRLPVLSWEAAREREEEDRADLARQVL